MIVGIVRFIAQFADKTQIVIMKIILILSAIFALSGCVPLVVGAAAGGAGGYVIGNEYEIHHRARHCWNEPVGHDYWGNSVYEQHCR